MGDGMNNGMYEYEWLWKLYVPGYGEGVMHKFGAEWLAG